MTDLEIALACADEADAIALAGLGKARDVARKQSASDLVTEFDLAVERAVVARLEKARPDDTIVGEEGASLVRGARRWYVDPIDGTTNFAHGLPFFAFSVGLVDDQGPLVGVISAPALGWRFSALRGHGAFLDERGHRRALRVSSTTELSSSLLATGFPYDLRTSAADNVAQFAQMQRDAQAVRRVGAASLDLAMTAAGFFDGYWEQKLKPWDIAAGLLLVTEAGGRVSGYEGDPVDLHSGKVVATNGAIHEAVISALSRVGAALDAGSSHFGSNRLSDS